jgi:hypothetical protein
MRWLTQLFSRRRGYDVIYETIHERVDEKIADLTHAIAVAPSKESSHALAQTTFYPPSSLR